MKRRSNKAMRCWGLTAALLLGSLALLAQRLSGELRLVVLDPDGVGVEAAVALESQSNQLRREFRTDLQGRFTAQALPFGSYRLEVRRAGFAPVSELLEIDSAIPLEHLITLRIAPFETKVVVNETATLLDPIRSGATNSIGSQGLSERAAVAPGRDLVDMVSAQPGWLTEANGVLHPRGSEYDTQYVIDGVPIVDNRSPGFAPGLDVSTLESVRISTAGFPAEYGRKLGGVVELNTAQPSVPGLHGKAVLQGASFTTQEAYLGNQYVRGRTTAAGGFFADRTHRYLDPPVEENFTNRASLWGASGRLERDLDSNNRVRFSVERRQTGFLVPNERVQQQAGQRQDRSSREIMGQASYQHIFNTHAVGAVHGMARDLSARLWSNPLSTPIEPTQDRGFREGYFDATLSMHFGHHEIKAGAEAVLTSVHEQFAYRITDRSFFSRSVSAAFNFAERANGDYEAWFAQDRISAGHWSLSAGLRWDRYQLRIRDHAFSPRLGVTYSLPEAGVVLRASYDRVFEIPAIENLLLASSQAAQRLTRAATGLPIPASRGNFYEAGLSKSFFGSLRLDANYFRRNSANFEDDDLLLNTGVSFPTTFRRAEIYGIEAKVEIPRRGRYSGWLSYSNLLGVGKLPVTGGLFLQPNAAELLRSTSRFAISQDQRNTLHGMARVQLWPRVWVSITGIYGSGLPADVPDEEDELAGLQAAYGGRVLDRVNSERGRIRPAHSFDLAAGVNLWGHEGRAAQLQAGIRNLTNQFNLINFASLFSGTALAPPRSFALRLQIGY